MKLPELWNPDKYVWGFGFWSSGPESLPGDGLLTYHNLEGKSEAEREQDLVELHSNPIIAIIKWFVTFYYECLQCLDRVKISH